MNKFIQNNEKTSQNYQAKQITINNNAENSKDNTDLKKSHPIAYISTFIAGGVFTVTVIIPLIMLFANQEIVTKNSYTLNKDIEKEYVSLTQYLDLSAQNKHNETEIESLKITIRKLNEENNNQDSHSEWLKRYDELAQERLGFENQLNNLNNFSTGIKNNSENSYKVKKDELLRKIQSRDEQIKILLEKL